MIQLCEQTLDSAEKNFPSADVDECLASSEVSKRLQFRLWRYSLIVKSYFRMGRLEEGLASLEKKGEQLSTTDRLLTTFTLKTVLLAFLCHSRALR